MKTSEIDQQQKIIPSLFRESQFLTTKEIANILDAHTRTALNLCKKWANILWTEKDSNYKPSNKAIACDFLLKIKKPEKNIQ